MKKYILVIACLFTASSVGAATITTTFDFGQEGKNGERGAPSITFVQDTITVIASGTVGAGDNEVAANAYLDYDSNANAGLGICQTLNGTQCATASDDNVTYGETLILDFGEVVLLEGFVLRNGDHGSTFADGATLTVSSLQAGTREYDLANVFEAPDFIRLSGNVFEFYNPNLGGDSNVSNDQQFYLNQLTVSVTNRTPEVPVPAAVWLFGSGLLGLVAVARRKATV